MRYFFTSLITLLLLCPTTQAWFNHSYTGVDGGDWNTAGNWSPSGVPTKGNGTATGNGDITDERSHGLLGGNKTINIDANAEMWILHLGWVTPSTLNLNAGTLEISGAFRGGRTNATGFFNIAAGTTVTAPQWQAGGWNTTDTSGTTLTTQTGGDMLVTGDYQIARRGQGTHIINDGTIQVNGTLDIARYATGSGTFLVNGGAASFGAIRLATQAGATGVITQTGGTVRSGSLTLQSNGTYSLEGGTLGVNAITDAGGTFTWGAATLTTRLDGAGNAGSDNYASGDWGQIRSGVTLAVTGDLTADFGTTASTLDLRDTYLNNGQRIDIMTVSGTLDLSSAGDTLNAVGSPYALRPNIGAAVDYGSIPLITAGTLIGTFDTFTGITQDNIGWTEYSGVFTSAADLPVNTWFLEQNTSSGEINFHYKVEGTVPEPGTMGLLALGVLFVRTVRSR